MSENLVVTEVTYTYRTDKDTGHKRPNVELQMPLPNTAAVASYLAVPDSKEAQLIVSLTQQVIIDYVRGYVDADLDFDQEKLNALYQEGKLDFVTIANLPSSARNVTSKEDLENFAKAYIAVMVSKGIVTEAVAKTAAGVFIERFKRVAGDNNVLSALNSRLQQFLENADEEVLKANQKAIEFLAKKLEELLSVKITADAL